MNLLYLNVRAFSRAPLPLLGRFNPHLDRLHSAGLLIPPGRKNLPRMSLFVLGIYASPISPSRARDGSLENTSVPPFL